MSQRIAIEPFTKFLTEAFKGKLNHFKNILNRSNGNIFKGLFTFNDFNEGIADPLVQSLASRLIQSSPLSTPALSDMNPAEWQAFGGRKLVKAQAVVHL